MIVDEAVVKLLGKESRESDMSDFPDSFSSAMV
jgi:hypothetical protein